MRHCATCKHAEITKETRAITLPDGSTVRQEGGMSTTCKRPGGAGNIVINHDADTFDCSTWEPRDRGEETA